MSSKCQNAGDEVYWSHVSQQVATSTQHKEGEKVKIVRKISAEIYFAPSMTLFDNETLDLMISLAGSEEGGEERVGGREVTRRRLGGGDQGRDLAVSSLVSQPRGTGDNLSHPSALGPQKRLSLRF